MKLLERSVYQKQENVFHVSNSAEFGSDASDREEGVNLHDSQQYILNDFDFLLQPTEFQNFDSYWITMNKWDWFNNLKRKVD